ncbi:MAG: TIGR04086 family membrane protein [Lachnospiraceae bacterium]|nr:TIGR04086 family membrane protein [Lachnospiraceae bacterium]
MKNVLSIDRMVALLKCLMASYLITGVLLLTVAGLLYKFSLGETVIDICIIVVYCISSLLAGMLFSKGASKRRFLWGMSAGAAYFVIICVVSAIAEPDFNPISNSCITTLLICLGSGMMGGMIG